MFHHFKINTNITVNAPDPLKIFISDIFDILARSINVTVYTLMMSDLLAVFILVIFNVLFIIT